MDKWNPNDIIDKDILELIGAEGMEPEKKEQLYKTMLDTIQTRVMSRIDDLLTDDEANQIKGFMEDGDYETFSEFMGERNIDIKKIYAEETLLYKIELTDLINGRAA